MNQQHEIKAEGNAWHGGWKAAAVGGIMSVFFIFGWYFGVHQLITNAQTPGTATSTSSVTIPMSLLYSPDVQPKNINMAPFWRTLSLLNENFTQTHASTTIPTDQEKINGAIAGLVDSYGDPYTTFFPPSDAKVFDQNVTGSFGGVGMEIGNDKEGNLVVISPLKGNPAEAAGIVAGDKIIAIDSTISGHMRSDEAVKIIRGPIGSTVKVTVIRGVEQEPRIINIVRGNIVVPNIKYSNNAGTGIFEIDLYSFSAVSSDNFRDALRAYFESGSTKLLLDLRGNPGGYLEAAVNMASYFLPAGETIVTEDYKGRRDNVVHRSLGYNVFANKKLTMAILIDQGSASASEILAGALQQNNVGVLVGTRSFGKGSVQQIFDLDGGAQLKVTVARWLTPNGTSISDGGLTPNINATTTPEEHLAGQDPQKDAAVAWLSTH